GRPFLDVVRLIAASPDRAGRSEVPAADVAASAAPLPPANGLLLLLLDPAAPPLADGRVRALIAASVDRAQLARHFLPGGEAAELLLAPTLLPALPLPPPRLATSPAPIRGRL